MWWGNEALSYAPWSLTARRHKLANKARTNSALVSQWVITADHNKNYDLMSERTLNLHMKYWAIETSRHLEAKPIVQ